MKALTVQQPWAWAIVHGGKDVENRTQAWTYRGPLAIHAGARWSARGGESLLIRQAFVGADQPLDPDPKYFTRCAIIGVVDLVDVHHTEADCCESPWAETSYAEHGGRTRRELVHLVLKAPVALLEPVPCRGALGLWTVPVDVLERVGHQLRAVDDLAYQRVVAALERAGVAW